MTLDDRLILGVDPTSRGIAFVFLEAGRLLDWGTMRADSRAEPRLDRLLGRCPAEVLVLEDPDAVRCARRPRMTVFLRELARVAGTRGMTVVLVPRFAVRGAWAEQGITRKHQVARRIAERFPEVQPIVPRPRKVYASEEAATEIFDALSLVLYAGFA
jgi:hypothetical protein